MYADTVTIFNRYQSRLGDTFYPTVLHGVNLNIDKASVIAKYGENSQDSAILNIRYAMKDGKKYIGDKLYLTPKDWDSQTNDLLSNSLTFTSGQDMDFFYEGDWGNEDPISDIDYGAEGFLGHMLKNYDNVFAITSVACFSVIPHFEVVGK